VVFEQSGQAAAYDEANEVQLLRGMRDALVPKLPISQRMELQERLRAAIDAENYELAAMLRDELRLLK
jgi:protein-arginine kinase activator protein McsA